MYLYLGNPQKIIFSATLSNPSVKNSVVQYTDVITNIGGGYDPTKSTFVAPVQGNYFFAWSTTQYQSRYTYTSIVKNGSPFANEGVGWNGAKVMDSSSQITAIHLSAGDRVWIKHWGGTAPYHQTEYMGIFTGILLG